MEPFSAFTGLLCWEFTDRSPVNSPHKGQWRGALMFSLICTWMNGWVNKANRRDLIAATGLVFSLKIGFKSLTSMWPGNLMEDLKKQQRTSSILCQSLCIISKPSVNSNWSYSPEMLNLGKNWWFFCPLWPQNWRWPWKTIRQIFSATWNFVLHLIAIYKFEMELQSENAKLGQNRRFFFPCDLEIWQMTLKNNRAPLLCSFKRCVSFHSLLWNQNKVTVRKRQIWVKIDDFFVPCDIWNLTDDLEKQ